METESAKYYVDCYNASPTSMKDALALFTKISEDAEKRTYVLGTMAELGLSSHPHHKDIGSHIQPYSNDIAILVGSFAEVYKAGMLENGWDENNIFIYKTAEEASEKLAGREGYIFVKGSRVCELEKSLPNIVLENLSKQPQPSDEEENEVNEIVDNADTTIEYEEYEDYDDSVDDDFNDDFDDEDFDDNEDDFQNDDEDERETI